MQNSKKKSMHWPRNEMKKVSYRQIGKNSIKMEKENQLAKIDWLQYNIGPEYEVLAKWQETIEVRNEVDKKLELYLIFKKYKYLGRQNCFNLVKYAHILFFLFKFWICLYRFS
jgi:hypothetical protein